MKATPKAYTPGKVQKPSAKYENPKTVDEAVQQMVKICHKQAYKWTRNHTSEYDDLFSEGMCGVLKAWDKFHGSEHEAKGYRFSSYAFLWIRAEMKAYAEKNWKRLNGLKDGDISEMFDREEFGFDGDDQLRWIDLERRIERLPAEDRVIFEMRRDGFTFQEIADRLNAPSQFKVRERFLAMMG